MQARLSLSQPPLPPRSSNMSQAAFCEAVEAVREHIQAGNVFQLVLSQRFRRSTLADPFEIYRHALCPVRAVLIGEHQRIGLAVLREVHVQAHPEAGSSTFKRMPIPSLSRFSGSLYPVCACLASLPGR